MKLKTLLLTVLLIAGLIMSCGGKKEDKQEKSNQKYNEYVEFFNDIKMGKFDKFYNIYMGKFSNDNADFKIPDENSIKEIIGLSENVDYFEKRIEEMEKSVNKKPEFEVDKNLQEFLGAIKAEKEVMSEIIDYYKNGEYKKDNFEKGKQLHLKYVDINKKAMEKYIPYTENMKKFMAKNREERLKDLKNKGLKAKYYVVKFIDDTDKFSNKLYESEEGEFTEEDVKELKELSLNLRKTYEEWVKIDAKNITEEKYDLGEYNKLRGNAGMITDLADNITKKVEAKSDDLYKLAENFSNGHQKLIIDYNKMIGAVK